MYKKILMRVAIGLTTCGLLAISVAATYETYGRDSDLLQEKLQNAVEVGTITREQFQRKIEVISTMKSNKWKYWDVDSLSEQLQAAVDSGKITQEQADEKLEKIHSMKDESWKDRKPNYSRKSIP
jgi:predicted RNA-binding protein associated with RNAse of E/G family